MSIQNLLIILCAFVKFVFIVVIVVVVCVHVCKLSIQKEESTQ